MTTTTTTTTTATTRPRQRPSRAKKRGPALTASGIEGLTAYMERLRVEQDEYRELMSDPHRDARVVLELERVIEDLATYEALLAESSTIDEAKVEASRVVVLGSRVRVKFAKGASEVVRLVHPAEAFLDEERVSVKAPLAQALVGLAAGDTGKVLAPSGALAFTVVAVGSAVDAGDS